MKRHRCPNCLTILATDKVTWGELDWLQFIHERSGRCLAYHLPKKWAERKDAKLQLFDHPFN